MNIIQRSLRGGDASLRHITLPCVETCRFIEGWIYVDVLTGNTIWNSHWLRPKFNTQAYSLVQGNAVLLTYFYNSGFQTGVRGPKGVRDGFPRGPREDAEK